MVELEGSNQIRLITNLFINKDEDMNIKKSEMKTHTTLLMIIVLETVGLLLSFVMRMEDQKQLQFKDDTDLVERALKDCPAFFLDVMGDNLPQLGSRKMK